MKISALGRAEQVQQIATLPRTVLIPPSLTAIGVRIKEIMHDAT